MNEQDKTTDSVQSTGLAGVPGSILMLSATASTPRYRCPTCKHESGGNLFDACAITVSIEPHTGKYCLKCYAAWIAANVPKLEEILSSNNSGQTAAPNAAK